jgi:hypothetical protein
LWVAIHVSNGGCVLNSRDFGIFGIDEATATPERGIIAGKEGTNASAGLLIETAFTRIFAQLSRRSEDEFMEARPEREEADLRCVTAATSPERFLEAAAADQPTGSEGLLARPCLTGVLMPCILAHLRYRPKPVATGSGRCRVVTWRDGLRLHRMSR